MPDIEGTCFAISRPFHCRKFSPFHFSPIEPGTGGQASPLHKLQCSSGPPGAFIKTQRLRFHFKSFWFSRLEWCLITCMTKKFSQDGDDDDDDDGQGHLL